ncbi:MAG: hypothetical protein J6T22_14505 [Bacteroidales bacterium]|nr:hypothetical protein [Bacteroidales bacterium]
MAIEKPYYRIYRPGLHRNFNNPSDGYERDALFLPEAERKSMIMSARLIIDDFEHLFEYIEPHSSNENVFSHRIYELLLRTCTEVESCCKGILLANGAAAGSMSDYKKLEQSSHLSGYTVHYSNWLPTKYMTRPFANWAIGGKLPWYEAYNNVKHNRWKNFSSASLKNLLDAISGLLCVIHSQIGDSVQEVFESNIYCTSLDPEVTIRSFTIIPSPIPDEEKYEFEWNDLKDSYNRFQMFPFNCR